MHEHITDMIYFFLLYKYIEDILALFQRIISYYLNSKNRNFVKKPPK